MDEEQYQDLVRQIPLLTKKQMTDLRRRLLFLIGESGTGQKSDWILDGIFTVLRERGKGSTIPPNFTVKKSGSFAGYETQSDRVRELLDEAIPNMTLTEHKGMGVIAVRALADYISGWEDPKEVSLTTLMHYVAKIPDALDFAFPGYLTSGHLGFILRRSLKNV